VVIQITPQTELTHLAGEARPPGESSGIQHISEQGGESPQKTKAAKSRLGVFAQILSGLRKAGAGEKAAGEEKPESLAKTSESDARSVQKSKNKTGKGLTAEKKGEIELDLQQIGLSAQERNLLLEAGYLAGEFTDEYNELTDEGKKAASVVSLGKTNGGETPKAETVQVEQAGLETGKQAEIAAVNTGKPGEGLEIASTSLEKNAGKTRNRSEIAPKSEQTAAQMSAQMGMQQAEAKKAAVLGEKEGRNSLEQTRNRDKRRGTAIEVRDFRNTSAEIAQKDSVVQIKASAETRTGEGSAKEITLELRLPNEGQANQSAPTSWEAKAGQAFEDILARELHQNFNNDIVRHASVVLRDSSEGTIRLALKPESLGNVKIRLEMAENKITGQITVESEEALRAFEKEITSLEKAFVESGFEGANLEMSLAADGGGAQQWRGTETGQAGIIAASQYEAAAAEWVEMPAAFDYYYQGSMSVNVLA
jgi:flagellar protein FlbC